MILLLAVAGGLLAGFVRAAVKKQQPAFPNLKLGWLVPVAFLPQLFTFYLPATQKLWPAPWVAVGLVGSLLLLLIFAGVNYRQNGFTVLGMGILLNFLVISANGGMMPISPNMATRLYPAVTTDTWQTGQRLAGNKDVVLPASKTRLWALSDRFFVSFPLRNRYRVAFSLGDMLIALGIFWWLWMAGSPFAGQKSEIRAVRTPGMQR